MDSGSASFSYTLLRRGFIMTASQILFFTFGWVFVLAKLFPDDLPVMRVAAGLPEAGGAAPRSLLKGLGGTTVPGAKRISWTSFGVQAIFALTFSMSISLYELIFFE